MDDETQRLRRTLARVLNQFSRGMKTGDWYVINKNGGYHVAIAPDVAAVFAEAAAEVTCPYCGNIAQPGAFYRGRMFCNDDHFEGWDIATREKER